MAAALCSGHPRSEKARFDARLPQLPRLVELGRTLDRAGKFDEESRVARNGRGRARRRGRRCTGAGSADGQPRLLPRYSRVRLPVRRRSAAGGCVSCHGTAPRTRHGHAGRLGYARFRVRSRVATALLPLPHRPRPGLRRAARRGRGGWRLAGDRPAGDQPMDGGGGRSHRAPELAEGGRELPRHVYLTRLPRLDGPA